MKPNASLNKSPSGLRLHPSASPPSGRASSGFRSGLTLSPSTTLRARSAASKPRARCYEDPNKAIILAFSTLPQSLYIGEISDIMIVELVDNNGIPRSLADDATLLLSSTSPGGKFSLSASPFDEIDEILLPAGDSAVSFYYKDSQPGNPALFVSESPDLGLVDARQVQTVSFSPTPTPMPASSSTPTSTMVPTATPSPSPTPDLGIVFTRDNYSFTLARGQTKDVTLEIENLGSQPHSATLEFLSPYRDLRAEFTNPPEGQSITLQPGEIAEVTLSIDATSADARTYESNLGKVVNPVPQSVDYSNVKIYSLRTDQDLPDLTLTQEDIRFVYFPTPPEPAPKATPITVRADIHNISEDVDASEVEVVFQADFPETDWVSDIRNIPSIARLSDEWTWVLSTDPDACHTPDKDGVYLFTVTADPDRKISELDENNNSAGQLLQVGRPGVQSKASIQIFNLSYPGELHHSEFGLVSGQAYYRIEQFNDVLEYPVQGAIVTVGIYRDSECTQLLVKYPTSYTDKYGAFKQRIQAPADPGDYYLKITVFDGSITGDAVVGFLVLPETTPSPSPTVVPGPTPPPCCYPFPPGPDIYIYSPQIEFYPPANGQFYDLKETIILKSTFKYIGSEDFKPIENLPVQFVAKYASAGEIELRNIGVPGTISFDLGENSKTVQLEWTNWARGVYLIEAQVFIAPGALYDLYKENNSATRVIVVGESWPLTGIILVPIDDAVVSGYQDDQGNIIVDVFGVAAGDGFADYVLEWHEGAVNPDIPDGWHTIAQSATATIGLLGQWDVTGLPGSGEQYTLRLRVNPGGDDIVDWVYVRLRKALYLQCLSTFPASFNNKYNLPDEVIEKTDVVYELNLPGDDVRAATNINVFDGSQLIWSSQTFFTDHDGVNAHSWPGLDNDGNPVNHGQYEVEVSVQLEDLTSATCQTGVGITSPPFPVIGDNVSDWPDPVICNSPSTIGYYLWGQTGNVLYGGEVIDSEGNEIHAWSGEISQPQGEYLTESWVPAQAGIYRYTLNAVQGQMHANEKSGAIAAINSQSWEKSAADMTVWYSGEEDALAITLGAYLPHETILSLAGQNEGRNYLVSDLYDLDVVGTLSSYPVIVAFSYEAPLYGDNVKLKHLVFDEATQSWDWVTVVHQYVDVECGRIIAELYQDEFSLFGVFKIEDTIPPLIEEVAVSPGIFSPNGDGFWDYAAIAYTLKDEVASRLNVSMEIYDQGRNLVTKLLDHTMQNVGRKEIIWRGMIDQNGTIAPSGSYTFRIIADDHFGNLAEAEGTVILDTSSPVIEVISSPSGWINADGVIEFKVEDLDPGVRVSVSPESDSMSGPDAEGKYTAIYSQERQINTITITATDSNQNSAQNTSVSFGIDKTPPVTTSSLSETPNSAGWINTLPITVSFSASDNLSSVAWTTPDVTITEDGIRQIEYYSIDNAGNVEERNIITVKVDTVPPALQISATPSELWPPNHKPVRVTVGGSAADAGSGIESLSFQVRDEYGECQPVLSNFGDVIELISWRNGDDKDGRIYTITVTAIDFAGNSHSAQTEVLVPHDQRRK